MAITSFEVWYNLTGAPFDGTVGTGTKLPDQPAVGTGTDVTYTIDPLDATASAAPGVVYGVRSLDSVTGEYSSFQTVTIGAAITPPPAALLPPYTGCAPDPAWLPFTITDGEQRLEFITKVGATGTKTVEFDIGFTGGTSGTIQVDWGDGGAVETLSGAYINVTHTYQGADLGGNPPTSDGKHQALASVAATVGTLAEFRFQDHFSELHAISTGPSTLTWIGNGTAGTDAAVDSLKFISCYGMPKISDTSYYMFAGMTNLCSVPGIDTSGYDGFNGMFYDCKQLTTIPALDASAATMFIDTFYNCGNLTSIELSGARYSLSISGTLLDAVALNTFFGKLGTADNAGGQQTINIAGTPGAGTCDRSIAETKGWEVSEVLRKESRSEIH
jgi:hypothetical protein